MKSNVCLLQENMETKQEGQGQVMFWPEKQKEIRAGDRDPTPHIAFLYIVLENLFLSYKVPHAPKFPQ